MPTSAKIREITKLLRDAVDSDAVTAKELYTAADVSESTVYAILAGERAPSMEAWYGMVRNLKNRELAASIRDWLIGDLFAPPVIVGHPVSIVRQALATTICNLADLNKDFNEAVPNGVDKDEGNELLAQFGVAEELLSQVGTSLRAVCRSGDSLRMRA